MSRAGPEIIDRVDAAGLENMAAVARLAVSRYGIPLTAACISTR